MTPELTPLATFRITDAKSGKVRWMHVGLRFDMLQALAFAFDDKDVTHAAILDGLLVFATEKERAE